MHLSTLGFICTALLAVIWVLYPIAMGLLARANPRPEAQPFLQTAPTSLILASRATREQVADRIRNLLGTSYPADQIEIIVGLDLEAAATADEIRALDPRIKVAHARAPGGKAAALNAAVEIATGEVLVFSDTHQAFEPQTIPVLVNRVLVPGVGAVSGSLTLGNELINDSFLTLYWRSERWLREQEAIVHSTVGVSGSVYAMRRELWRELPAGLILDDLYIPMAVALRGMRVDFAPDARAQDSRDTTPEYEFHRKVRTLTGNFQLCALQPDVLNPWANPIWTQFVIHKLLRLLTPYLLVGVLLGLSGAALDLMRAQEWRILGAIALVTAALWIPVPWIRRVRDSVRWAFVLQAAIVVATLNALRSEWNVWSRR